MRILVVSDDFCICSFFFFNDTATTEIYTLSLHDALPDLSRPSRFRTRCACVKNACLSAMCSELSIAIAASNDSGGDRKSTRLNSSHANISYAVFCLKKKKQQSS